MMASDYEQWLRDIDKHGFRGYRVSVDWSGRHPKIYYQGRLVKGACRSSSDRAYGVRKAEGQLLRAIQEPPRTYRPKKPKRRK